MKLYSQYVIKESKSCNNVMIVEDLDPEGVTITIKDNSPNGTQNKFNLPRYDMVEALEYILKKIKSTLTEYPNP